MSVSWPSQPSPSSPSTPQETSFFSASDHSKTLLQSMHKMRSNAQLCDVEFVVGELKINAHRIVLAACSPYFSAMFTSDLAEKRQCQITLHDIDPHAIQLLVDFAYTGELQISEDNVQVLLPASSLLQLNGVREACCYFLLKQLHPSNCLGIRSFADAHACGELQLRSHKFALQNFQEVCGTEEFLFLPFKQVNELIASNQMNVADEETVFRSVVKWVRHAEAERKQHVSELMSHVKLPLLPRHFLVSTVDQEPLLRDDPACRELLLEALKYHLLPEQRASMASARTADRRPDAAAPYLFSVGGGSLFAVHSECEVYSPRLERWLSVAAMNTRRSRAGVATAGRRLYVIGGYDGSSDLSSAETYHPLANTWSYVSPMGTKRSCFGAAGLNGLIYCCGGYDGASCLSSVERYDPLADSWSSLPQMLSRRRYCRLAAMDNCLYAVGGFDSASYLSSLERLDPRVGKWMSLPPMSNRRSSCGVEAVGDWLYCVGGNDGTMCQSSGEKFSLRSNTWESVASMQSRRSTHELIYMGGRLYAVGGNDGSSSLNSVESYDDRLNRWKQEPPMNSRRSSVGAAVLHCVSLERLLRGKQWSTAPLTASLTCASGAARPTSLYNRQRETAGGDKVRRDRRLDMAHRGTL
ncbi:kelch-like protein 17 [Pollicipes pollicipes]|uniref:kelch-like protein 17 n=1 Tax=Pollicipes pollicipes TaxID=41117 RepID=UPI00188573FE|nr:kelch-like protein 17 [Pollicipes pollicipes]XP_037078152.1 kelch-like protein 17 [Pollicipes pollicipes]XP_037078153.1 kelch-like protein 17 [Pollicipes pollicipes]